MSDPRPMTGAAPTVPAHTAEIGSVRSLALRTDLAVLALGGSTIEDRGTHLVVTTPHNPGFWWGSYLALRDLPVLGGEREVIAAFHTEHPQAEHVAIALDGTGPHDPERLAPFVAAGLTVTVDAVLTTGRLVATEPAPEAELRPLAGEDWDRWVELELALSDRPSGDADRLYVERRAATERGICEHGEGLRVGAFVDGLLASSAGCYRADARTGRFQAVGTHPGHRRRGLAAAVVHAAGAAAIADLGVTTLVIVADPDGPAIGTYRRLGFTDVEVHTALERPPGDG